MIEFIIGKPGDGKTMFAVRRMLEHFRRQDIRPLVSNVRLDASACVDWLVKNSPRPAEFWYGWIREHYFPLLDEQLSTFFRYRGPIILDEENDVEVPGFAGMRNGKELKYPDYKRAGSDGVVYFLDEVHTAFPSDVMNISPHVLHYLSQHRKFADDVFCITQHPEQVSKKFRLLVAACHQLKNQYRQKFFLFKMPGKFRRSVFSGVPKPASVAFETEDFTLSEDVGKCYDTTAGAGVGGSRAPELKKAKGIPIRALWVAAAVFVVVVIFGLQWMTSAAGDMLGTRLQGSKKPSVAKVAGKEAAAPSTPGTSAAAVPPSVSFVFVSSDGRVFLSLEGGRVVAANGSGYRVFLMGKNALVNGELVELRKGEK